MKKISINNGVGAGLAIKHDCKYSGSLIVSLYRDELVFELTPYLPVIVIKSRE